MYASYQPAVAVNYFNENGRTNTKRYHYLVPDYINSTLLQVGGFAIVNSAGSGKPEVVEIVEILHGGSSRATKAIIGLADMRGHLAAREREAERTRVLAALAARERAISSDPMVRYGRLAMIDAEAAALYERLVQLGA